jgi:hypothetical protein
MSDLYSLRLDTQMPAGGPSDLGSARVSRVGFGVPPKQSFPQLLFAQRLMALRKNPRWRGRHRQLSATALSSHPANLERQFGMSHVTSRRDGLSRC